MFLQRCLPPVGERWFEFNDVHVTPIHSKDIPKMFQGRKSAYMVFYRRRSLQRPPECECPWVGVKVGGRVSVRCSGG